MSFIQIVSITATILFLIIIFRLIIKKRLREEFSVIWILCSLFLNIFAFWRDGIEVLARFFGIYYPPAVIFIMLFMALIVYCLHLSIIISKQKNDIKNLTQEVSFINEKLEKLLK
jgi:Uncharacterized conserved protein (DUF2304)